MINIQSIQASSGLKLAFRLYPGNDPVVVFLPGYKSDMAGAKATMLAEQCQQTGQACLLFDYSGHGLSEGEFTDGTIGRWTEDAVEVTRHAIGDRPVILVGSSMGGWIMLLSALKLEAQLAGMLGIAVAPDFTEELMWQAFTPAQQAELENKGVLYLPSEYEEPYPVAFKAILDGREHLLLKDRIDIDCPARFIHGMRDIDVPWEFSLRTVNQLASEDVQLRLLKDGNHRLSDDSQLAIIREMLQELV